MGRCSSCKLRTVSSKASRSSPLDSLMCFAEARSSLLAHRAHGALRILDRASSIEQSNGCCVVRVSIYNVRWTWIRSDIMISKKALITKGSRPVRLFDYPERGRWWTPKGFSVFRNMLLDQSAVFFSIDLGLWRSTPLEQREGAFVLCSKTKTYVLSKCEFDSEWRVEDAVVWNHPRSWFKVYWNVCNTSCWHGNSGPW